MQVSDIRVDEILERGGCPECACGTAVFDDGSSFGFRAMFAYQGAGLDVTIASGCSSEELEKLDTAREAVREGLGFDGIAEREHGFLTGLERKRFIGQGVSYQCLAVVLEALDGMEGREEKLCALVARWVERWEEGVVPTAEGVAEVIKHEYAGLKRFESERLEACRKLMAGACPA